MCSWLKAPLKAIFFGGGGQNDKWNIEVFLISFITISALWACWMSVKPKKHTQILLIEA